MARPGTWDLDMDGDALLADGQETVELLRQLPDGTFDTPVECTAVREVVNKRTAAGQIEVGDLVWHLLDAEEVGANGVRGRDHIRDGDGVEWMATGASLAGASDQWRVPCTKVTRATEPEESP